MVTGQDIVASAYKLKGACYRVWYPGASLPMWQDDGIGDPPQAEYLLNGPGVMCADLIDFALEDNGLAPGRGVVNYESFLENTIPFDPSTPGVPGAVAWAPYEGSAEGRQGHVALYVDEHTLIQALVTPGVTDAYTDTETYSWGGDTAFTLYGFLPNVYYPDTSAAPVSSASATTTVEGGEPSVVQAPKWVAINAQGELVANGSDYSQGWFDTGYHRNDWTWYGPQES